MQSNYPKDHALLAEWSGVGDSNNAERVTQSDGRVTFSGSGVRIPIDLNMLQAGGWVSETGTINAPIAAPITHATINIKRFVQPTSITLDLREDSVDNAAVSMLALLLKKAREALAENVNDAMNGNGDGLLATVASNSGSAGLVIPVAAGTDFDKLYPGKVVDIVTRSSGANPGNGNRRKITSVDEAGLTVTFSTTAQASDGDSGNITFANTSGIYTAGSYGNVMTGGLEAAANFSQSDTFQSVVRSTYPTFSGVDGRAGDSTTKPFSDPMADEGVLLAQRASGNKWDFGIGDPRAINVYKNGKLSQVRYDPQTAKISSGFSGIVYDGVGQPLPLIPERKATVAAIRFLRKDAATLYGRSKGPEFDSLTGSIEQRFSRALPTEFWLVDRLNWGWHDPASIVSFEDLSVS